MAETPFYKYIVVGCGGIGSAALYWLARKAGKDVLGLEQFQLGHNNGGSQDHSRIIRLLYHDEKYTKIVKETYKAWEEVEAESGVQLVHKVGSLQLVKRDTPDELVLQHTLDALRANQIEFQVWNATELRKHFPQFTVGDDVTSIYQADGGLVDAAMGNSVHVQLARARGARVVENSPVTRVRRLTDGRLLVETPTAEYRCDKLIVTAGAWVNHVIASFGAHVPVVVTQEQVTYFSTPHVKEFTKAKFPVYIFATGDQNFYGFPSHGNSYSKIGIDCGGPPVTANTRTFQPDSAREQQSLDFLKQYIPKAAGPIAYTKTCLYTMPKDRTFVLDTLQSKGYPEVILCVGAGHVYKWASLFGKILSELAVDGRTHVDISPFRYDRPAINDPAFRTALLKRDQLKAKI